MQDLQLEALRLQHPLEAAVVAVDGQREALVVFWGSRSMEKDVNNQTTALVSETRE